MSEPRQRRSRRCRATYEPCEECGAPLDPQQRYCVNCAARRGNGANPSSRYFAAMSKRARRPLTRPPAKAGPGSRAAAVGFFALLPIAVALGVVVGRSGSGGGDNEALLQALRQQDARPSPAPPPAGDDRRRPQPAKRKKRPKPAKPPAKGERQSRRQDQNGDRPPGDRLQSRREEKVEEDTQMVEENPEQTGDNYIKAQQNLPDVTVVGGDPGAAPAPTGGVEP